MQALRRKEYRIDIPPIAWHRPAKNGKRNFDSQTKDKLVIGISLNAQHGNDEPFTRAIAIEGNFFFKRPKSHGKSKAIRFFRDVPDADNLIKFYLDTFVKCGILSDDRIVVRLVSQKLYCDDTEPHVTLTITEVE